MKRWLFISTFFLIAFSIQLTGEVLAKEFRQTGRLDIDYLSPGNVTPFYPATGYALIITRKFRIRISEKDWTRGGAKRKTAMQKTREKALTAARKAGADGIHFQGFDTTGGGIFYTNYDSHGNYTPGGGTTVLPKKRYYLIADLIKSTGIFKKPPPEPPEPPWKPDGRLGRPVWPFGKNGGDFVPPLRFKAVDGSVVAIKAGQDRVKSLFLYLYNPMALDPRNHVDQLSILSKRYEREIEIMAVLTDFQGLGRSGLQSNRGRRVVSRLKEFIPDSHVGMDPGGEIVKALGWLPPGFPPTTSEIGLVIDSEGRILCSELSGGMQGNEIPCAALGGILAGYWPHQKQMDVWRGVSRVNPH